MTALSPGAAIAAVIGGRRELRAAQHGVRIALNAVDAAVAAHFAAPATCPQLAANWRAADRELAAARNREDSARAALEQAESEWAAAHAAAAAAGRLGGAR